MITRMPNPVAQSRVNWCWIGALTNNSVTIKAKIRQDIINQFIQIKYSTDSQNFATENSVSSIPAEITLDGQIATFKLKNLEEDTRYYYIILAGGGRYPQNQSEYLTFKTVKIHQQYSFAIGCSSCAGGKISQFVSKGVSNSKVFDIIRQQDNPSLDLFIHMGDLHYRNDLEFLGLIEENIDDYRENYHEVMLQERQRNLYQNLPLAYIWDDHDYGPNNSDGTYALKQVASQAYREQFPHYPLANSGAIYQSFVIGRVRFIMTDCRFYRDPIDNEDDTNKSLLGMEQREWLLEQLLQGKEQQATNTEGLTIWVNSVPWIASKDDEDTKSWNKYAHERKVIANFIKQKEINKLLMISGDAHMLALDDGKEGTANSYAHEGGGSFPVVHAASLSSKESLKGGPYNQGAIPGSEQWGVLHFQDNGNKIEVKVELKRKNETKIAQTFTF